MTGNRTGSRYLALRRDRPGYISPDDLPARAAAVRAQILFSDGSSPEFKNIVNSNLDTLLKIDFFVWSLEQVGSFKFQENNSLTDPGSSYNRNTNTIHLDLREIGTVYTLSINEEGELFGSPRFLMDTILHEVGHHIGNTSLNFGYDENANRAVRLAEAFASTYSNFVGNTFFDNFAPTDIYAAASLGLDGKLYVRTDVYQYLVDHDAAYGTNFANSVEVGVPDRFASPFSDQGRALFTETPGPVGWFQEDNVTGQFERQFDAVINGDIGVDKFVSALFARGNYFDTRALLRAGFFSDFPGGLRLWGRFPTIKQETIDGINFAPQPPGLQTEEGRLFLNNLFEEIGSGDSNQRQEFYGHLASNFGSSIEEFVQSHADAGSTSNSSISTIFGQVATDYAQAQASGNDGDFIDVFGTDLEQSFSAANILSQLQTAPIGTVSSFLTAENASVNDPSTPSFLDSVVNGAVEGAIGELTDEIAARLVERFGEANPLAILGSTLGRVVVNPQTQAAQVLSSLGSLGGSLIAGTFASSATTAGGALTLGAQLGNAVLPVVGAFIGFVAGAILGNLFGKKKKPKVASASATTNISLQDGTYMLSGVTSQNSGNVDLLSDIAKATTTTLNGFVDVIKGGDPNARNISAGSLSQTFGHTGSQLTINLPGQSQQNIDSAQEAVSLATLDAIDDIKIAGGNLYMKRVLENNTAETILGLSSDLKIAEDYAVYKRNQDIIDAAIAAPYESLSASDKAFYDANVEHFQYVQRLDQTGLIMGPSNDFYNAHSGRIRSILGQLNSVSQFAAGWIITLQRAAELGLNKSAESDFYGGAKGFVDSLKGIVNQPLDYDQIAFRRIGSNLEIYFDENKNSIANFSYEEKLSTSTNFFSSVGADGGVGYAGGTSHRNNFRQLGVNGAQDVDERAYGGNDIIRGSSLSNTIYGGAGDDWIDGGSGASNVRDYLYGGAGNDVIISRGYDVAHGESGDDVIYGNEYNNWITGGSGDDKVYDGGGGYDSIQLGSDDDVFYALDDNSFDRIAGNTGIDMVSYTRFDRAVIFTLAERGTQSSIANDDWQTYAPYSPHAMGHDGYGNNLYDIEGIEGSAYNDAITGNSEDNILRGGAGNDHLFGALGNDILEGGAGADTLFGYIVGRDAFSVDTVSYEHSLGGVDVSINLYGNSHAFGGDASGDVFIGQFFNLTGSAYADVLEGNHVTNIIEGLAGDDYLIATVGWGTLDGGEGFDTADFGNHVGGGLSITDNARTYGYQDGVVPAEGGVFLKDIEHVVGTDGNDTIRFGAGDNVLEGGLGNDTLYGGAGNDIYFVELSGGSDTIYEYGNQGHDTIMVGYEEGLTWDDVFIGAGANLEVQVDGQLLATAFNSPDANRELVGVDAIDIGGVGAIDVWYITGGAWNGPLSNGSNTVLGHGDERGFSLLQGLDGDDTIWSARTSDGTKTYETNANILHGGRGNDTIYASVGDDQYIFDRGSGRDTVRDTGGIDHIQFGPGVRANELVFEVLGNDLYIGIAPAGTEDTSDLNASQMQEYIKVVGAYREGGFRDTNYGEMVYVPGGYTGNLLEYITVENVNIDLRTLDIWPEETYGYEPPAPASGNFSVMDTSVDEGGILRFTVAREGANTKAVTINYNTDDGTADSTDYTGLNASITFDAGQSTKVIEVETTHDTTVEAHETVYLNISTNDAGVTDGRAAGTITNNDEHSTTDNPSSGAFSIADQEENEGGVITFTISRENPTTEAVSINYWTENGNTNAYDYTAVTGVLDFAAGVNSLTVTVQTTDDGAVEGDEFFTLNISGNASFTRSSAIGSILNNDTSPPPPPSTDPYNPFVDPSPNIPPIAFDLDGDGLELTSIDESRIVVKGSDKSLTRVGWLGSDDGFLALDRNGDGKIESLSEISFAQDIEGATSDLEGLKAYDTNDDGVFDARDERWGEFRIWRDLDQNGRGSKKELQTLEEAGITSIDLNRYSTGNDISNYADSVIVNNVNYTTSDGDIRTAYDVALATTVIQEGRESSVATIGQDEDVLNGRLGRISTRRLEKLLADQDNSHNISTVTPIVLDLNSDGDLDLTHLYSSGVEIDVNDDGELDRMGWVGASDGFLALDRNGDGLITAVSEISFVEDLAGAKTDLEGLAAFDSNGDGVLDASDARFSEFRVWQDSNQDGVSQLDEIKTLEEAGLTSVNLSAHIGRQTSNEEEYLDNVVFGQTVITWSDGREGIAGDVGLRVEYQGVFAEGAEGDQFLTGFVGLESVHVNSAAKFEKIALDSDWGRIAGHRSPLMAMLYEAEEQQAELDALGSDLGMTQDELLAEFEANDSEDGEVESSGFDVEQVEQNSSIKDDGLGYIKTGEDLRVALGAVASVVTETTEAANIYERPIAASLDQFNQAMAGFGRTGGFEGVRSFVDTDGVLRDIFGAAARHSDRKSPLLTG